MKQHKRFGVDKLRLSVQTIYTILTNGYLSSHFQKYSTQCLMVEFVYITCIFPQRTEPPGSACNLVIFKIISITLSFKIHPLYQSTI